MTDRRPGPDEWIRVNDLFHRALAEPADRRAAFLADACRDEPAILAEVTSLLAAHDDTGDFIETPAVDPARLLERARETGPSLVGQTLGHYVIERMLGEGGMGVVYLAQDTRLARQVALKALAPRLTGDAASRERLRREARAAAGLAHPGIATVYALEEIGDELYIAAEYVPGETLRDEIRQGPLPVNRVLDTGLAIARALAAAHDRGLVHRDIKPENIMRTPSGVVKVLDFGLARVQDTTDGPPRTAGASTLFGTPAYMSPEQIRGRGVDVDIDARADLFALGIVMYELATGAHPFAAADSASTIARILESEPTRRGLGHSAALDAIIDMCLQKTPEARFQSAHTLVRALEEARQAAGSSVRWWWQFHEAAAAATYVALLYPLWLARAWMPDLAGLPLFTAALVAALVASTLRLHLWFTLQSYPSEWRGQRRRLSPWIRMSDVAFVASLTVSGAAIATSHAHLAMLLVAAAVAVLLSFTVIEPATTRAAFDT